GMTAAEAEELSASAEVASIINMIDYEFRNIPHWTWTRELLKKNHVGDLRFVSIDWISGGKAKPSTDLTWQNQKEQGGGVLFGFGPHIIDYIEWFFGPIKSVLGKLTLAKSDIKENRSSLAEDTCNMIFELESCPIISVSVSNVMPCGRGHFIEIYGEKGALKLGSGNLRDSVYGFELWEAKLGDDKATKLDLPKEFAPLDESFADGRLSVFIKQAQKFIESIESGVNAGPTFKDGLRNQIILDAIRESDKTSSWIAVN
ncbi:MAG: Gfo/Idh/MocA family oxidoreductase, partial [bacterium]|nr:Gfo/Idh/MocA family oxidoreductase [bacterium]